MARCGWGRRLGSAVPRRQAVTGRRIAIRSPMMRAISLSRRRCTRPRRRDPPARGPRSGRRPRARRRRRPRSRRPRPPGRATSAASSPRTGSCPAGSPRPARRCPAPSRGSARTGRAARGESAGPDRRGRQHPQGACEHGRLVGEDVAEEVLGDDDVECGRMADSSIARSPPAGARPARPGTSAWTSLTTLRHSRDVARTFALSTLVRLPPAAARELEGQPRRSAGSRPPCTAGCPWRRARPASRAPRTACRSRGRRSARGRSGGPRPRAAPAEAARGDGAPGGRVTGRRLANRPRPPRSANSACSGRTFAFGSSHFGPPTAPRKTASAPAHADVLGTDRHAVGVDPRPAGEDFVPLDAEPVRPATALEDGAAPATTSGPTPSPGMSGDAVRRPCTLRWHRSSREPAGWRRRTRPRAVRSPLRGACWPRRGTPPATPR